MAGPDAAADREGMDVVLPLALRLSRDLEQRFRIDDSEIAVPVEVIADPPLGASLFGFGKAGIIEAVNAG